MTAVKTKRVALLQDQLKRGRLALLPRDETLSK